MCIGNTPVVYIRHSKKFCVHTRCLLAWLIQIAVCQRIYYTKSCKMFLLIMFYFFVYVGVNMTLKSIWLIAEDH